MELKSTIDIILKDLDEARSLIDDLKNYPGVPRLQIELAKSKCRSAGDVIKLLGEIELHEPDPGIIPDAPVKEEPFTETISESLASDDSTKEKEPEHRDKGSDKKIVADKFSHLSDRINEKIAGSRKDHGITEVSRSRPVADLKEAIGINDRFYFVREVFGGNQELYSKTLEELNSTSSIDMAREIILSATSEDSDSEAIDQLMEIVKRKFSSRTNE